MRSIVITVAVGVAAVSAGFLAGAGADPAAARAKFVGCGKYSLGFTDAKVRARGMKCRGAKDLFKKWQRRVDCPGNPCERTRVESFVCRFGGTDVTVRLRCEHRTRDRAMKARWGG